MTLLRLALVSTVLVLPLVVTESAPAQPPLDGQQEGSDEPIDFDRARELLQRMRDGETLTPEERAYLERAREERRGRRNPPTQPAGDAAPTAESSLGLIPLTDMSADQEYQGEDGGLYGTGRNEPPAEHLEAALEQAHQIEPLDAEGMPDSDGKIVIVSSGMSNTRMKFDSFLRLLERDPARHPAVVAVNGAQGGRHALTWNEDRTWEVVEEQLAAAGVTSAQVQVMWMEHAMPRPASDGGEFPGHAQRLKEYMALAVRQAHDRYPNLKLIYLSSRAYAGYAETPLNPEPYAYESAFAVRWLIQQQMEGIPELNHNPEDGAVEAPVLLWGPYLWADGIEGRESDDLVWLREDFADDGTHPSQSGGQKAAELLLDFFQTDPTARVWYLQPES